jgi:hypothetical protein
MPESDRCANCEATLRGEYCQECGQRAIDLEVGLWQLAREALGETFEADGRLAATLIPFFFRPGHLVSEFLAGRRVRYSSPVRIYIFATLVCFLALGFASRSADTELVVTQDGVQLFKTDSDEARANHSQRAAAGTEDDALPESFEEFGPFGDILEPGMRKLHAMDPEDARTYFVSEVYEVIPKILLLLVPLFAVFLKLAWFRNRMVEHLLFAMNLHAVGMVVIACGALLGSDNIAVFSTLIAVAAHGIVGAKRVYGRPWLGTIVRSFVVGPVYGAVLIAGVVASALIALAFA